MPRRPSSLPIPELPKPTFTRTQFQPLPCTKRSRCRQHLRQNLRRLYSYRLLCEVGPHPLPLLPRNRLPFILAKNRESTMWPKFLPTNASSATSTGHQRKHRGEYPSSIKRKILLFSTTSFPSMIYLPLLLVLLPLQGPVLAQAQRFPAQASKRASPSPGSAAL